MEIGSLALNQSNFSFGLLNFLEFLVSLHLVLLDSLTLLPNVAFEELFDDIEFDVFGSSARFPIF